MTERLYIAEAGRKGKGVFARVSLLPGTLVIEFSGREGWIWNLPREDWEYALQVDFDRYVLPVRGSPGWFLNHSCDPNCVLSGKSEVRTWRRIAAGEELTLDYSTNVGWEGFEMVCDCRAEKCRQVIKSYNHLSQALKERYGKNVSPYLLGVRG